MQFLFSLTLDSLNIPTTFNNEGMNLVYKKLKRLTYQIIEKAEAGDKKSLVFDCFIIVLIFLNVLAIILESFATLYDTHLLNTLPNYILS